MCSTNEHYFQLNWSKKKNVFLLTVFINCTFMFLIKTQIQMYWGEEWGAREMKTKLLNFMLCRKMKSKMELIKNKTNVYVWNILSSRKPKTVHRVEWRNKKEKKNVVCWFWDVLISHKDWKNEICWSRGKFDRRKRRKRRKYEKKKKNCIYDVIICILNF